MSIFRNYDELVENDGTNSLVNVLEILEVGVRSVLPDNSMKEFIEKGILDLPEKVTVLGWGKASAGMFNSFNEHFNGEILQGCVIARKGEDLQPVKGTIEITFGAHPLPDESSVRSGRRLLEIAEGLNEDDTLVCLISGGGSSMFEVPKEGIELECLRRTYHLLLGSGADIHEMNSIRRALSQSKGGGLARAAYPARIINIIISDVPGNNLEDISSGPSALDPMKIDPKAVIEKHSIGRSIDGHILEMIQNYRSIPERYFKKVETQIIADNSKAQDAMMNRSNELGYGAIRFPGYVEGEARDAVNTFLKTQGDLIIGGGETTVTIRGNGKGGRNQEFVLAGLKNMVNGTLVSIGTDGIDGNSDTAGALGDVRVLKEAYKRGLKIDTFLENNNSYEFFEKCGGLLKTGPTGTNVADICILLR
jgi:glycerate-2-kinase